MREKEKGDALAENGMYVHAIRAYQDLLKQKIWRKSEKGSGKMVYHNLGCAYSYLFQMEKALECFLKAYEEHHSRSALKTYLLAFHSIRTPIEYESRAAELGADREVLDEIRNDLAHFARQPGCMCITGILIICWRGSQENITGAQDHNKREISSDECRKKSGICRRILVKLR